MAESHGVFSSLQVSNRLGIILKASHHLAYGSLVTSDSCPVFVITFKEHVLELVLAVGHDSGGDSTSLAAFRVILGAIHESLADVSVPALDDLDVLKIFVFQAGKSRSLIAQLSHLTGSNSITTRSFDELGKSIGTENISTDTRDRVTANSHTSFTDQFNEGSHVISHTFIGGLELRKICARADEADIKPRLFHGLYQTFVVLIAILRSQQAHLDTLTQLSLGGSSEPGIKLVNSAEMTTSSRSSN